MSWPTCRPAAFHGLAGDLVAELDPHTEADPLGVLAQFLAAFGNALGRGPGFTVGRTRHYTNLYVVAVGQTSKGRKGTSVADATYTVRAADPPWEKRVTSGLSSAEGLIHEVRDERREKRIAKKNETDLADADGWIEETVDFGVQDKRLLVIEPEFASAVRRSNRSALRTSTSTCTSPRRFPHPGSRSRPSTAWPRRPRRSNGSSHTRSARCG